MARPGRQRPGLGRHLGEAAVSRQRITCRGRLLLAEHASMSSSASLLLPSPSLDAQCVLEPALLSPRLGGAAASRQASLDLLSRSPSTPLSLEQLLKPAASVSRA